MVNHEVIDNFLPQEEFKKLQDLVLGRWFPWYWNPNINDEHIEKENDTSSYFVHYCFGENTVHSYTYDDFQPLIKKINPKALIRLKVNCYPATKELEIHQPHIDYEYPHKGCIFYFNTCNGYTILEDGTRIESVANRALFFDASRLHSSTSTTNAKARFNVNMNYF